MLHSFSFSPICFIIRPHFFRTSRSHTCPFCLISSKPKCSPPSSTTRLCLSGRRKSLSFGCLTDALRKPDSTMSVHPVYAHLFTRNALSSKNRVRYSQKSALICFDFTQTVGLTLNACVWNHCYDVSTITYTLHINQLPLPHISRLGIKIDH